MGQGRENSKDYLRQTPELAEMIETAIREQVTDIGILPDDMIELDE